MFSASSGHSIADKSNKARSAITRAATDRLTGLMWVTDGNLVAARDRLTGLVWIQSGPMASPGVPWRNAFSFVADMNSGGRTNFGHGDYRLRVS
jgi:hypothetical protein